jgi:hypothetical protein
MANVVRFLPYEAHVERREKTLIIEVPRTSDRSNLRMCRARAKVIAAREGIRTEPEVATVDDERLSGGPMRASQGWVFTFDENGPPN